MTRITYNTISNNVTSSIQANAVKLNDLMTQLASGKALNTASDDPVGVSKVLKLNSQSDRQDQYLRNLQNGEAWLATSETALETGNDVLQRANELAIQGANDTYSATERAYMCEEVRTLAEQMVSIANTTFGSEFIFSGTQTDTPPYSVESGTDTIRSTANANGTSLTTVPATVQLFDTTLDDSNSTTGNPGAYDILPGTLTIEGLAEGTDYTVEYKTGTVTFLTTAATTAAASGGINASYEWIRRSEKDMSGSIDREIQEDNTVAVNVSADSAFGSTSETSVFDSLIDLMQGLHTNDTAKVKSSASEVDESLQRLLQAETSAGSRANRLSTTEDQNQSGAASLQEQTSLLEDVEYAKTITDYQTRQSIYEASLQVGALIIQPTLLDFL